MTRHRSVDFYINKYGIEKGQLEYNRVVSERNKREARKIAKTSVIKESYSIDDVTNGDAIQCLECKSILTRLQWTHFKYNCTGNINSTKEYKNKYPTAKIACNSLVKNTAVTLLNFIKLYGDVEGNKKWQNYCDKQAETNSFNYKLEKYGWTEEQFREFNLSRSITKELCIKRHGELDGLILWKAYCDRQAYTNTLAYNIEKFGNEVGLQKYKEINKAKAVTNFNGFSNIEKEFTNLLETITGKLEHTSFNNPFSLFDTTIKSYYIYDIKHNNCIIEFNGDYWHATPLVYNDNDVIRNKFVKDIWARDASKISLAESNGFRVLTIWEHEYCENKIKTIERVAKWIMKEQQ